MDDSIFHSSQKNNFLWFSVQYIVYDTGICVYSLFIYINFIYIYIHYLLMSTILKTFSTEQNYRMFNKKRNNIFKDISGRSHWP